MASVDISPSEEHTNSDATFEITVDQTELLRADVTAEEVAVLKATDNGYRTLETSVVETNGDVRLQAETDGFSAFIVSTDEGDITTTESTDDETDGDEGSDSDTPTETDTPMMSLNRPTPKPRVTRSRTSLDSCSGVPSWR